MDLIVSFSNQKTVPEMPVEMVERKGKGHPDSLCDAAAEEVSVELSKYFLSKYNKIFHHNVDKAVLAGGQARVEFGGGEVTEPIYILMVGRATRFINGEPVPVEEISRRAIKNLIKREMRYLDPDKHVIIDTKIRGGSVDLVRNFEKGKGIPLANDTSFGVGFAPFSAVENITLNIERHLNSEKIKEEYPAIGEDIKVMSIRTEDRLKVIIACAFISKLISNEREYDKIKNIVKKEAEYIVENNSKYKYDVTVNAADDYRNGIYYITVTGTSAEHGDDGQVGRGNRANGLITPFRTMTLEATAGKNPVSHTGKLYSITAQKICNRILLESQDVKEVYCYMVSSIGHPINEPKAINLKIIPEKKGPDEGTINSIVKEELDRLPNLWKELLEKKINLF
ncbi:MAG TPA: methionine adenosyltransferase [Geobacterales bacterium]|nr:methionine adenosyltransferase [Geobacterales bacterium]